jgi:non-specific serine/threonine protein kinase
MTDPPSPVSHDAGRHNLPVQMTALLGRDAERQAVCRLLLQDGARLVTLTGPGGTGKTRLGLQVAADLVPSFADGVFLVELAAVTDPALVPSTIAQVLGVRDPGSRPALDGLKEYLRRKSLLLLLDNFEQIVPAGPAVAELLACSPGLTVLVTSREPLYLRGEREFPVPPLPLPEAGQRLSPEALTAYAAVALFVARAAEIRPGFRVTAESARAIAEICARLDGLPLAIELAAARVRLLTPEAMLARLEHRLPLLTHGPQDLPARQRTLRDAIAWSYDLLTPCEQVLFRRLAIFVGGCTLDAAEAVARADVGDDRWTLGPDEVLEGVESLVAKNLLRRLADSEAGLRVTMLETVRELGIERLTRAGELAQLRRWHAAYFLDLAERAVPLLRGPEQTAWLDRLEAEHANLRAALTWALAEGRPGGAEQLGGTGEMGETALRLGGALAWFWATRAHAAEGTRWLTRALSAPEPAGPPAGQPTAQPIAQPTAQPIAQPTAQPAARLRALYGAGWLAHVQRDQPAARRHLDAALTLARAQADTWATAWTLHLLGRVAYYDDDWETARALGEQSLAAARATGDPWLVAWALHLLGLAAHIAADYETARAQYTAALQVRERLGFTEGIGICHTLLAIVAYRQGDHAQAFTRARACLHALREVGAYCWVHNALAAFVSLGTALRQPGRAVRLAGATAAFGESVAVPTIPLVDTLLRQALDEARRALDPAEYERCWEEGRGLSLDAAIAEALAVEGPPPAAEPPAAEPPAASARPPAGPPFVDSRQPDRAPAPAGLSPREIEVLRLLARGRMSREIADALVLSVRTVERHITNIYAKIGARGRADATAFAIEHGLL